MLKHLLPIACFGFILLTSACDSPNVQLCKTLDDCDAFEDLPNQDVESCIEDAREADDEDAEVRADSEGADCAAFFRILNDLERCSISRFQCVDDEIEFDEEEDCEDESQDLSELINSDGFDCTIPQQ